MKSRRLLQVRGLTVASLACIALGACASSQSAPQTAQAIVCPELSGSVDLLHVSFSADPAANGRIRAFTAAARGLYDAALEMQRLAADACRRMGRDLGAPTPAADASLDALCAPVKTAISSLASKGVQLRVAIAAPRCGGDDDRKARCDSTCPAGGADCASLCHVQAELYARCSMPSISLTASSEGADVARLARTLEDNLPTMLYAELALGRRLLSDAQTLVATAARLPNDVKSAGERGVACTALAAAMTTKAAGSLRAVIDTSATTVSLLDPETAPPSEVPR